MHGGFRVEPGSAARDAEQRAREAGPAPFRNNVGIRVGGQVGRKFEIESRPATPEEPPVKPAAPPPEPQPEVKAAAAEAPPSAAARLWGKFRGLFSRK
jgi:hypothetical protein